MTAEDPDHTEQTEQTEQTGDGQARILLVEDNPLDVRATLRAAKRLQLGNRIDVVGDGDTALAYLSEGEPPDLVLLDLNLPGKDGIDVLKEMQADDRLKRIPVVVLTTSDDDADVLRAYDHGANAFVTKPVGLEGWIEVAAKIEGFWLSLVRLPPQS